MRTRTFTVLAVSLAVLLLGAVGVYAYDASQDGQIAKGVKVGGVDVGEMNANQARAAIQKEIAGPYQRSITISYRGRDFHLTAGEARLHTDVEAMVQAALKKSREGNIVTRSYRGITGGSVDANLPAQVSYSQRAVERQVRAVSHKLDRPAQDASVAPSPSGLSRVPGKNGVEVQGDQLRNEIVNRIEHPTGPRSVAVATHETKPKVKLSQLASRYPHYITIDRGNFKLRYYKNLKLKKTYGIAVGMQGLETPAGTYPIENKSVNPAWNVPNRSWAGPLAGKTIPGGAPDNPLKARWLGVFNGAGIHGTADDGSIGTAASHGCIRMHVPDVIELYDEVNVGTPVYIGN
jgi:lipoprotein-anchoring transpeptidase ErfK/SrfK